MNDKRRLPKGRLGVLPKLDKQVRPTGELGWLTPLREAKAGGGWWLWSCRCGTEVSKLARNVRSFAASGGVPKCSALKCTWKAERGGGLMAQPGLPGMAAAPDILRGERSLLASVDAIDWLRSFPAESVDLIVTDPAYESLEKHRAVGTTTRLKVSDGSSNQWFPIFPNIRFPELFAQLFRVLKRDTHFYMYCDQETMFVAKPMAEAAGFRFWKPIVWDKVAIGMGYHYRARYELVLFFEKGKRKLNDLGIPDVITCKRVRDGYPTQKPEAVSEVLIGQSTQPGELVIDPFMGSASVGVAALKLGRRFAGTDVAPAAVKLAGERLLEWCGVVAEAHP